MTDYIVEFSERYTACADVDPNDALYKVSFATIYLGLGLHIATLGLIGSHASRRVNQSDFSNC